MVYIDPNVVDLVAAKLNLDATLTAIDGYSILTNISMKALASSRVTGRTIENKLTLINETGGGGSSQNAGSGDVQEWRQIEVETYVRTLEDTENAKTAIDAIYRQIRKVLVQANFDGTGILDWHESSAKYTSVPLGFMAAHRLVYEFLVTFGGSD